MAKKNKKAEKAKAKFLGQVLEAKGADVAHKIWLAGVGAYGKAYDAAADGVGKVGDQSGVMFEDLVKRGEEIESDVRARLSSNTAVTRMAEQMNKVNEQVSAVREKMTEATGTATEAVTKFQEEQRERLEARMERMRDALGLEKFTGKTKKAQKLHSKLDDLEEQVAELRANSEGVDDAVKSRVERLSTEIAAVGGKVKKTKKKATKAKAAVKAPKAKKAVAKKPAPKKAAPKAKAPAAPKADANGRLKAAKGAADDLKVIKGVGPVLEGRLNDAGVFHYWQIAAMKKAQAELLDTELTLRGRITRDGWVAQAKSLAK
ncbi:MAG: phasin family protein [Pseudomonadota bacterium]